MGPSSTSMSAPSARHTDRSPFARRRSISAYSTCSGLGDNSPLAQRAIDHRAPDLRAPLDEGLIHDDHIHRGAEVAKCPTQLDRLGSAIGHLTLDDQEVEVAPPIGISQSVRAEQDHLRRFGRSIDQGPSGPLNHGLDRKGAHRCHSPAVALLRLRSLSEAITSSVYPGARDPDWAPCGSLPPQAARDRQARTTGSSVRMSPVRVLRLTNLSTTP